MVFDENKTFLQILNHLTVLNKLSVVFSQVKNLATSNQINTILRQFPVPFWLDFKFNFYFFPFSCMDEQVIETANLPVLLEAWRKARSRLAFGSCKTTLGFSLSDKIILDFQVDYFLLKSKTPTNKSSANQQERFCEVSKTFLLKIPTETRNEIFSSFRRFLETQKKELFCDVLLPLCDVLLPQKVFKKEVDEILSILKRESNFQPVESSLKELQNFFSFWIKTTDFFLEHGVYGLMKKIKSEMDNFFLSHQEEMQKVLEEACDEVFERSFLSR